MPAFSSRIRFHLDSTLVPPRSHPGPSPRRFSALSPLPLSAVSPLLFAALSPLPLSAVSSLPFLARSLLGPSPALPLPSSLLFPATVSASPLPPPPRLGGGFFLRCGGSSPPPPLRRAMEIRPCRNGRAAGADPPFGKISGTDYFVAFRKSPFLSKFSTVWSESLTL